MCGIAGVLDYSGLTTSDTIRKMISKIRHRGPDASGIYAHGPITLGHQRLSIIDVQNGHQPMSTKCGRYTIVFNGEIFNHIEIRENLRSKGFNFSTKSDTEVALQSYLAFGNNFTQELNGQWSLAIWDRSQEKLLLSRDRPGIRPLFYYKTSRFFAFASESKSLFCHPKISPELSPTSLLDTLTFWSPLPGKSIFSNIRELLPGETISIHKDDVKRFKYWDFSFPVNKIKDHKEASTKIRDLLVSSTKLRLRSDVPVASYLSGGLDSFIISSIAAREQKLSTFSLAFPNTLSDESEFQHFAAKYLQTEHHTINFDSEMFNRYFEKTIWHIEKPILRAGPIPLIALSELVRNHGFKVVLTGEGADEIFCGYDIFREFKARLFLRNHPQFYTDRLFEKSYNYSSGKSRFDDVISTHFFKSVDQNNEKIASHLARWRNGRVFKNILSDDFTANLVNYDPINEYEKSIYASANGDWLESAQKIEYSLLLPGYILSSQSDRVGLAHGVEGRFPFLDHNVIELANSLPNHFKLSRLNEKHILKESFNDIVPKEIIERQKRPYESPISDFIKINKSDRFQSLISDQLIKKHNIFSASKISAFKEKINSNKKISHRDSSLLLAILSTQQLAELFLTGQNE